MKAHLGWVAGAGAGLMAGAVMGAMLPRNSMKTQVGRSIRKLGIAVDKAVDNLISELG